MGARIGTGHHDPAALIVASMRVPLMRGGELRRRSGPRERCSATSAMPKYPATAAGKAVAPSSNRLLSRLQLSTKRHQSQLQASASSQHARLRLLLKGKQRRLQVSAKHRRGRSLASASSRRHRLRGPANSRQSRLQVQAAASSSPVLAEGHRRRPGHLRAPLVVTGEPTRQKRRASGVRPAARAM
jgi:hypothetical protein